MKGCSNLGITIYECTGVVSKPQETFYICNSFWGRPTFDGLCFLLISLDPPWGNYKSKTQDLDFEKFTFTGFQLQPSSLELFEDSSKPL